MLLDLQPGGFDDRPPTAHFIGDVLLELRLCVRRGFGRIPTDAKGGFRFTTIKPGRVPAPGGGLQAPHLVVSIFMRGMLKQLATRLYFPDEAAANAEDPVLKLVPAARRATMIPRRKGKVLEWDIVLQGKNETVFLDYF